MRIPPRSIGAYRSTAATQLDMFAEFEAADKQRRADEAPALFGITARGYRARVAAYQQWVEVHGHFDSFRRSHAWHAHSGGPGRLAATGACRPTILCADLCCHHRDQDCYCVGGDDLLYRGACLHCQWEGPVRKSENAATEDAHDHAWPAWRDLPLVPRRPEAATSRKQKEAIARWATQIDARYPSRWLQSGGPIRTSRIGCGTRHIPDHTGFGGYDMCGEARPERS